MTATDDLALEARLRHLAGVVDPVPPDVRRAARAAFALRRLDAELAELTFDSWSDDRELVGVRGPAGARQLTFEGPTLTVEIEVGGGDEREIVGQIVPPQPADVDIVDQAGACRVEADELGRFSATTPLAGPVRLRCQPHGAGSPTHTDWLVI